MNNSKLPVLVSFGEALTDLIRESGDRWVHRNGGAPWNLAIALRGLGVDAAFGGAISREPFGQALHAASEQAGLDLRFIQPLDKSPLLAIVHETRPPSYYFIGDDSADLGFDPAQLPAGWRGAVHWAHFGGISLAREPLAARLVKLAEELKGTGVRISYDPNFRAGMDERYDATLQRMCRIADLIKVSDEDLCGLFRTPNAEEGLQRIAAWSPQALLMLTRGADGAELHADGEVWRAVPPKIELADAVGAGDASMAGLLASLLQRADLAPAEHLRWAVASGAAACERTGFSPPTLAQVELLAACVSPASIHP